MDVERRASYQAQLPPHPASVGEARRIVRARLGQAGRTDLLETAELVVSEVVTNALLHAGTSIDLTVHVEEDGLRVAVHDGSAHMPTPRSYDALAGTGRGLMMLEQLVDAWGVLPAVHGKIVWFHLGHGGQESGEHVRGSMSADVHSAQEETVDVVLGNMPLLLHRAWHQHAEALLREYTLASIDGADEDAAIRMHAEATEALTLLAEQVPPPLTNTEDEALLDSVSDPRVSGEVVMRVPLRAVPHFQVLDDALDGAVALADQGRFLTSPSQPEIRMLRRWLCRQVAAQSAGAEPVAWTPPAEHPESDARAVRWDPARVRAATTGLIAVDDVGRILAASGPALQMLGYDESGLVGQRLVAIIPERLRQAHLAGFTLHALNGRGPLIGQTVTVPALRSDGTEIAMDLTIRPERSDDGNAVFVGEVAPHG